MSEAPERITAWLSKDGSTRFEGGRLFPAGVEVEYIRADRIEELEAKLAKAVEHFKKLRRRQDCLETYDAVVDEVVETALTELKGGKDE